MFSTSLSFSLCAIHARTFLPDGIHRDLIDRIELSLCASISSLSQSCCIDLSFSGHTSPMLSVSQSSFVLNTSPTFPHYPRFHNAPAVCCRDQAQEPSAQGWLERQFLQKALMCRSVKVFGSHVGFVVGDSHFSQTHDLVTNGVLDPQPTNFDVSGL